MNVAEREEKGRESMGKGQMKHEEFHAIELYTTWAWVLGSINVGGHLI